MQFGLDVSTYKRLKEGGQSERKTKIKDEPITIILSLLCGLLLGRVMLFLNEGNVTGIAPFGIAYLLAVVIRKNEKMTLMAALGVSIGYLTINGGSSSSLMYIMATLIIVIYDLVATRMDMRIREIRFFGIILISYLIFGFLINRYDLGVNITLALVNTIVIIPIYYIIKYAINCIEEFNSNYFFSSEEIISMGILLCLMVSGVGSISLMGVSLRNILAYSIILLVAYVGGGAYGTAVGVSMGIIVGMSTGDMMQSMAFYSVIGLISGIFKDTGKVFSFLAAAIMYFALALYSQNLSSFGIVEILIAGTIYLAMPQKIYDAIEVEIDTDKKREMVSDIQLNELKTEFANRVKDLGEALLAVSATLENIGGNEKLLYKNKSTALVENLADRVCANCGECKRCWNRDFTLTYNSFQTLIESCEGNDIVFPKELDKRCIKKFELIRGSEQIISTLNVNELLKQRLEEGRMFLANHIKTISSSIDGMLDDFKRDVTLCGDVEKVIRRALNKNSINYKNIFCYRDNNGRVKIKVSMESCGGGNYCAKSILPIVNSVMRNPMCIDDNQCRLDPNSQDCSIVIQESPKYHVVSYGAMTAKNGEQFTGDTYSFGKTKDGTHITLISDGMGSGPEAGKESKATVELVEKFIESGFGQDTAINMVNSIMSMKFEEDEKFSTLDLNTIDLYSGQASFIKVGAVASFIKRNDKIRVITSNMPPFGLVDKVDVEEVKSKVKNGDIIVTLSDGVLDVDKDNVGGYEWLDEYLKDSSKDPKQLAVDIVEKAKELSGGIAKDDMTVVVSKIYAMY